ncbi:MAG: F0F1 ATP synthase subunit epsilon [Dehalococcoidia bacterium]|nr:F0F1 ATP synthase subunit epsilon [Dehalococcoidia bacterium]
MPLTVEIVTIERIVRHRGERRRPPCARLRGQLAILPRHAAIMTTLDFGELTFRRGNCESHFAIAGGFMEVRGDQVSILADQAEAVEEIDVDRAQAARRPRRGAHPRAPRRPRRQRRRARPHAGIAPALAAPAAGR